MVDTDSSLLDFYIKRLALAVEEGKLTPEQMDDLRDITEDPNWLCNQYNTSGWTMRYRIIAPFFLWLHDKRCPDLKQLSGNSEQFEEELSVWKSTPGFESRLASKERLDEIQQNLEEQGKRK